MSQGLEKILENQKGDLNPHDGALHKNLEESIDTAKKLRACMKDLLGGNCSAALLSPKMPITNFQRKQWSHTLLETATEYLGWLKQKNQTVLLKLAENKKLTEAKSQKELNGV